MKLLTLIFVFLTSHNLSAQNKLIGRYRDYFGSRIQINPDSTFKYTWNFDMQSSWTKGTWQLKGDTIYFKMVPVYDTTSSLAPNQTSTDSLVLSADEISERLGLPTQMTTPVDLNSTNRINPKVYQNNIAALLSSGGQNKRYYLDKLIVKNGKLYLIKNGKAYRKKVKGFWTNKKWPTWYFTSEE
jgi:hypothetical protein